MSCNNCKDKPLFGCVSCNTVRTKAICNLETIIQRHIDELTLKAKDYHYASCAFSKMHYAIDTLQIILREEAEQE